MEAMDTHFARAERQGSEIIRSQREKLQALPFLNNVIRSLPYLAFILNQDRQLLLANETFRNMLSIASDEPILGKRPGEIVNCIHAKKMPGGCGTSDMCEYCDAIGIVLESKRTGETTEREARLITDQNGTDVHFDLLITSAPIDILGETYFLVTMVDITSQKRRAVMERVFFHDVMNIAHGLTGTLEFMENVDSCDQMKKSLKNSQKIADNLVEEISFQRDIIVAESGDLKLNIARVLSTDILEDAVRSLLRSRSASGKNMVINKDVESFPFNTDERILRRVIINMIKNALEASDNDEKVELSARLEGGEAIFAVHNNGVMPRDVQAQLWQRSFSTKGSNRGVGTYSMKMFTEQYLGGTIDFISNEDKGTVFTIHLKP